MAHLCCASYDEINKKSLDPRELRKLQHTVCSLSNETSKNTLTGNQEWLYKESESNFRLSLDGTSKEEKQNELQRV